MLARIRAVLVLLLLTFVGSVGLAAPAHADSCQSPWNYNYELTGLTLTQSPGSPSTVGGTLYLTATVTGTQDGTPNVGGICVDFAFTQNSPNLQPAQKGITDKAGKAYFSYKGNNVGTDGITAQAVSGNGGPSPSARLQHTWTVKPSPTPSPTKSPTPRPTTPSPTPSPTKSPRPTASPTPSPTPSPTLTPTPTPTPSPSAVPTSTSLGDGSIKLDEPSALPGGSATLHGRNCPPSSTVNYSVEGTPAGSSTAAPDGTFDGDVQLPNTSIGQHLILVTCEGRTATVAIDLVVSSSSGGSPGAGATAAAVLVFFVLLGSVLFARNNRRS